MLDGNMGQFHGDKTEQNNPNQMKSECIIKTSGTAGSFML
jgi:hypothetical protein